jgi:hypothetical protein
MGDDTPQKIVTWPSDEEIKTAFHAYTLAVGKVAFAWNFLHERLGRLFVAVTGMDREIAFGIWYSTDSDRTKQLMLKGAILAAKKDRWLPRLPKARDDLIWLTDRVIGLGEARNNAIHAPCTLLTDWDGSEMGASFFSGHERAKKLLGKDILVEFDWCEAWSEDLSRFCERAETAINFERYSWPDKPAQPNRRQKKDLPNPRRPSRTV